MPIYSSANDSSAVLNTSAIAVPSVATMIQHLVDADPHPQYILGTDLTSLVKSHINVGDLADVNFGLAVPEDSIMIYKDSYWSATAVSNVCATSANISAVSEVVTSNANQCVSAFNKTMCIKEENVELVQSDVSVAASATVSGHVLASYDANGAQVYPDITYSNGISTIVKHFGMVASETWMVVHTSPINMSVTSGVISGAENI